MTDAQSPETRLKNMRAIRSTDTKPELIVREELHTAGLRYRLVGAELLGRPALVLSKYKTVLLVNGWFWHGHDCRYFKLHNTRREFLEKKIYGNQAGDAKVVAPLSASEWCVAIVWECAIMKKTGTSRSCAFKNLVLD